MKLIEKIFQILLAVIIYNLFLPSSLIVWIVVLLLVSVLVFFRYPFQGHFFYVFYNKRIKKYVESPIELETYIFLGGYLILLLIMGHSFINSHQKQNIGFGLYMAVLYGGFFNTLMNRIFWKYLPERQRQYKDKYSFVNILGPIEIILYFVAIKVNPEFIGFWIGLKVAVTWSQFTKAVNEGSSSHHIFLIGNGLNILWAFIGTIIAFGCPPVTCYK
ncbi:MAG: hypothetical protein AB7S78_01280 [Candidatus Omnitrophota bacterium]